MTYKLSELMLKIELVYDKPPLPGWQDVRRSIHVHSLYWVHQGTGVFTLDGRELEVGAGTLLYLKPGIELMMKSATDHPLHMTMILFQTAVVIHRDAKWQAEALEAIDIKDVHFLEGTGLEE
jgi:AraC family transcriptional regulator